MAANNTDSDDEANTFQERQRELAIQQVKDIADATAAAKALIKALSEKTVTASASTEAKAPLQCYHVSIWVSKQSERYFRSFTCMAQNIDAARCNFLSAFIAECEEEDKKKGIARFCAQIIQALCSGEIIAIPLDGSVIVTSKFMVI